MWVKSILPRYNSDRISSEPTRQYSIPIPPSKIDSAFLENLKGVIVLYFIFPCILYFDQIQISHHPPEELSCASHRTLGGDVGSTPGDAKCNVHNFLYLKVNL